MAIISMRNIALSGIPTATAVSPRLADLELQGAMTSATRFIPAMSPFRAPFFANGASSIAGTGPSSPLRYQSRAFDHMLHSPQRKGYYDAFQERGRKVAELRGQPFAFNDHQSYLDRRTQALQVISDILSNKEFTYQDLLRLYYALPIKCELEIGEMGSIAHGHALEVEFMYQLARYLEHESTHCEARGVVGHAMQSINVLLREQEEMMSDLFDLVHPMFVNFLREADAYFDYHERLNDIGTAFFGRGKESDAVPQLTGGELQSTIQRFAHAFALRFVDAYFEVCTGSVSETPKRNRLVIAVDPDLQEVRLPLALVATKFACDIKNTMRVVLQSERQRSRGNETNSSSGLSLVRALFGQPIERPVVMTIQAVRRSKHVWELQVFDNGRGIVVEELFQPLSRVVNLDPERVSPSLRRAVERWDAGDPFAFNRIPYGELLESVFHLGVSAGTGGDLKGSGMGLWGSLALLTRLHAQLRVGVTPKTNGMMQSIFLPIHRHVPAEEVARVAKDTWSSEYRMPV